MVKNEAQNIRGVLEAAKPHIDQYLFLDTGSTDGTQDIIREVMTGVPGRIVEEPFISVKQTLGWDGFEDFVDFAATKNRVLDLVAQLDDPAAFSLMVAGDEFLRDGEKLREHLEEHRESEIDCHFVYVQVEDTTSPQPRVLRTGSTWRYLGELHECPANPDPAAPAVIVPGCRIDHVVSDPERRYENIEQRHIPFLQRKLEDNPNDERALIFLAQSYEVLFPFYEPEERDIYIREAIALYLRRLEIPTGSEVEHNCVRMRMLDDARLIPDFMTPEELYSACEELRARDPKRPEVALLCAQTGSQLLPVKDVYKLAMRAVETAKGAAIEAVAGEMRDTSPVSTSCLAKAQFMAAQAAKALHTSNPDWRSSEGQSFLDLCRRHADAAVEAGGSKFMLQLLGLEPVKSEEATS